MPKRLPSHRPWRAPEGQRANGGPRGLVPAPSSLSQALCPGHSARLERGRSPPAPPPPTAHRECRSAGTRRVLAGDRRAPPSRLFRHWLWFTEKMLPKMQSTCSGFPLALTPLQFAALPRNEALRGKEVLNHSKRARGRGVGGARGVQYFPGGRGRVECIGSWTLSPKIL